jgi:hypothetical protein
LARSGVPQDRLSGETACPEMPIVGKQVLLSGLQFGLAQLRDPNPDYS